MYIQCHVDDLGCNLLSWRDNLALIVCFPEVVEVSEALSFCKLLVVKPHWYVCLTF